MLSSIQSIRQQVGSIQMKRKTTSLDTKKDFGWWRIIATVIIKDPWCLAIKISNPRRIPVPTDFVVATLAPVSEVERVDGFNPL